MSVIISFLCLFSSFLYASSLPGELTYQGKTVDPLCLAQIKQDETLNLSQCASKVNSKYKMNEKNTWLSNQGYQGYRYRVDVNDPTAHMEGYSYYKIIGKQNQSTIVQTLNNMGGTGELSQLLLLSPTPQGLRITVLDDGGDRCNHGLLNVKTKTQFKQDSILYGKKITTMDFLTLANDNPKQLKPYDDLDDCAICCKAVAVYQQTFHNQTYTKRLTYIDLSAFPQESTSPSSKPYQACFDKLMLEYLQKGQTQLSGSQLSKFMGQFNARCNL